MSATCADAGCQSVALRCAAEQVLTVADGALNDETVIAFVRDDNRIRFDINRAAANAARTQRQLEAVASRAPGEGPVMLRRLSIRQKLTVDADADQRDGARYSPPSRS